MPESREERVKCIVDGAPPLTDEQLAALAVLLEPETRTLEARSARACLAIHRRWQPGSSDEKLLADLKAAKDDDDLIDQVVARAPKMTEEQARRIRRLFNGVRDA